MTEIRINDANAMQALGEKLAGQIKGAEVIYLSGELGAGKTTLVRGFLTALGHVGSVKSPTYTLVEPYSIAQLNIYHFDLYRINDPEELEAMGIRDYCEPDSVCLFEWPEQGENVLPAADIHIDIAYADVGRSVTIESKSDKGLAIHNQL